MAENVDAVAAPPRFQATGGKDIIGRRGMEQEYYTIPNIKAEAVREIRGMRVHAWRGIGAGYNKFASESFLDEIASARGVDPLAVRLELTKDHPRAQAVIKAVAEMADWKRKRAAAARACVLPTTTTVLRAVAEVSVDRTAARSKSTTTGSRSTPASHPAGKRRTRRLESGMVYGLSAALSEELTVKDGAVQQSNFDDYHVLRMSDLPEIHTGRRQHNPPTGMGELGVRRRAGDRQRRVRAHRQAAAAPADVAERVKKALA